MNTPQEVIHALLSPHFRDYEISEMMGLPQRTIYSAFKRGERNLNKTNFTFLLHSLKEKVSEETFNSIERLLDDFIEPPTKLERIYFGYFL